MDTEKVPLISVEKLQVEFEGHKASRFLQRTLSVSWGQMGQGSRH